MSEESRHGTCKYDRNSKSNFKFVTNHISLSVPFLYLTRTIYIKELSCRHAGKGYRVNFWLLLTQEKLRYGT